MDVGWGLNSRSREGHHSQLMLPTTATTTLLFLPDSRARMRRGAGKTKKRKK